VSTGGASHPPGLRIERATAVTDGSGYATVSWPAGAFTAPPVVTIGLQGPPAFRSATITANSPTSTTVNVQASAGITLLGLGVLAVGAPAPGVTVHATAVQP
jgi:hypothetical protein